MISGTSLKLRHGHFARMPCRAASARSRWYRLAYGPAHMAVCPGKHGRGRAAARSGLASAWHRGPAARPATHARGPPWRSTTHRPSARGYAVGNAAILPFVVWAAADDRCATRNACTSNAFISSSDGSVARSAPARTRASTTTRTVSSALLPSGRFCRTSLSTWLTSNERVSDAPDTCLSPRRSAGCDSDCVVSSWLFKS